ncbi:hypothetical protein GGF31_004314 [Allomyces arbusculus]|nr:hypothetical protein GGF31_004314 [Allomyces arbusculus]
MGQFFREHPILADPVHRYSRKSAKKDMWMVTRPAFQRFVERRVQQRLPVERDDGAEQVAEQGGEQEVDQVMGLPCPGPSCCKEKSPISSHVHPEGQGRPDPTRPKCAVCDVPVVMLPMPPMPNGEPTTAPLTWAIDFDNVTNPPISHRRAYPYPPCGHVLCGFCLENWIRATLTDRSLRFPPRCPCVATCSATLTVEHAQQLFAGSKFHQMFLEYNMRFLEATGRLIYCPQKTCSNPLRIPPPETLAAKPNCNAECPNCKKLFCAKCRVPSHRPLTCEEFQAGHPDATAPDVDDIALLDLARTMYWKRCPSCRIMVDGYGKCIQMRCRCGRVFCYRCGTAYTDKENPVCPCKLFDARTCVDTILTINLPLHNDDDDELLDPNYRLDADPDNVEDDYGEYVLDHRWSPNDWPRTASGRRLMAWGVGEVQFPKKDQLVLPKWLAKSYKARICHYCNVQFPKFSLLVNHFHTTNDHNVYLCCNRTFKNEQAYFDHLNYYHSSMVWNW